MRYLTSNELTKPQEFLDIERLSDIMAKMSVLHDLTHKLTKCLILIYYAFIMLV